MRMKLSEIKIKDSFAVTTPNEDKMDICRNYWNQNHEQDRYIVVNRNNVLIDGYIQYLILKENNVDSAQVKVSGIRRRKWARKNVDKYSYKNESTTYVYGVHPNSKCNKEYVWRVPKNWTWFSNEVQIGDRISCRTKFGYSPVNVTRVEILDKCPVDLLVKKVAKNQIIRSGCIVA